MTNASFRSITLAVFASAALAACAGSSTEPSTGQMLDDTVVTAKVRAALIKEKGIDSGDIAVETNKGRVLLSGYVNSPDQRQRAEGVTRQTEGVKQVLNKIEVK